MGAAVKNGDSEEAAAEQQIRRNGPPSCIRPLCTPRAWITAAHDPLSTQPLLLLLLHLHCTAGLRTWFERTRDRGKKNFRDRTLFDWCAVVLPCLTWLRTYKIKEFLVVSSGAAASQCCCCCQPPALLLPHAPTWSAVHSTLSLPLARRNVS